MTRISAQQRSDPETAREIIDAVFLGTPNGAKRSYYKFLAAAIKYLSRRHRDRWGITLLGWGVRLNVGWVECLILHPKGLSVLVKEDLAPAGTRFDRSSRKWAPGCRYTTISLPEIPRALASFTELHYAALRIAARRRPPENIRKAHSVGVTKLLLNIQGSVESGDARRLERRFWTSYWRERNLAVNVEYEPVAASGSDSFSKRGVSVGDVIYIMSQHSGLLLLAGRMTVGRIVSRDEAVRIRKRNDLYDADEWVIGKQGSGTALHQHRQLAPEITRRLRFISGSSARAKALLLVNDRHLDRQTIRGVRELTSESASLLDEIIEMTEELPRSGDPTVISGERLGRYRIQRDLASALHEEIQDGVYVEGSVKQVLVNRYERDPGAREMCIRQHGTACSTCGFDFTVAYGEVATGFIHVHHLIPLSDIGADYVVNPFEDLRPVCPNCHAIIHRRSPPYSIKDVQRFLESRRSVGR
jgi:5-methylcytosine-specific restriction endonuclease McrA